MALSIPKPVRPAPLYGNWTPALFKPKNRSIGGIVAEVTIEEAGTDDVQITQHPVEQGSPIADHAFKQPSTVNIRAGWSVRGSYDLSAETGVYGLLLSWQAALLPFDVITGKRSYSNMLIERLQVTTDQSTEFALMATITCKQVIIVATQEVEVQSTSENPANHKDAESTSGETKKGEVSPEKVKEIQAGDSSEFDYGGDQGTRITQAQEGDTSEFQYGEGQQVESAATRNTTEQANVEKNIEMNRPERAPGQGTLDILNSPDRQAAQQAQQMQAYQRVAYELTSAAGPTRMPRAVTVGY